MVRLWHEKPDRWRQEILASGSQIRRCVVFGGEEGPRWVYESPETAIYDPAGTVEWPRQDPRTEFSFMLDPSEELFSSAPVDDATVHKTGRRTAVAGREAVKVRLETVSWGYPPQIFHDFYTPMASRSTCYWSTRRSGRYCGWRRGSKAGSSTSPRPPRSPTTRSSRRIPSGLRCPAWNSDG